MVTASELRPRRWWMLWAACYAVLIGTILWSMFYAKRQALDEISNGTVDLDWQVFREDVQQRDEHLGPVERRVPKSVEPPAVVLLRDYFGVLLAGAIGFSTLLYWVIAWLVMGAMATGPAANSKEPITAQLR